MGGIAISSGVLGKWLATQSLLVSSVVLLKGEMGECMWVKVSELFPSEASSRALPPVMMGMLRDSFRRRLGDDGLMAKGGGEYLRQVLGDLGASPYRNLALWLLENKSSSDLWRGEEEGEKAVSVDLPTWLTVADSG